MRMSKYIKLDSAIKAYNQAVKELVESEMEEFELGDFTECSFNTTQIKLIARMIDSLPTIEVSEDAISREWVKGICEAMLDEEMLGHMIGYIEDAPSVVSKAQTETQNSNKNSNVISVYDGVSEAVRCAMCSNPNKSDRGCDGACSYDEKLYKRIMDAINASSIEVSEDAVSREQLKSLSYINKGNFNSVEGIRDWIDAAPSVIPKPKEGEWIDCNEPPITEREEEKIANKPIRIDGYTEKCPKCGEKVMYAVGTGVMFHGASESYEDWRVIKHDYCPRCGTKIEREGAE